MVRSRCDYFAVRRPSVTYSSFHFAAEKCRDILLNESINALKAMEEQQLNQSFIDVIETNLIIGGMVGGFGDDYGRTAVPIPFMMH